MKTIRRLALLAGMAGAGLAAAAPQPALAPAGPVLATLVRAPEPSSPIVPATYSTARRFVATAPLASADGAAGLDSVRGVVRAVREATLSSRLAARIVAMPVVEGQAFAKGAVLVEFDCERQAAESRAAAAAVQVQTRTVETNQELDKFNSIGKNDLLISISQLDKVRAEAAALLASMKDCRLVAPYAGRVVQQVAHSFEAVAASQPLLKVVDTSELELDLIVPSAWLRWLAPGASFEFQVDETGTRQRGTVVRLTPTVDPVSKTARIVGRFAGTKAPSRVLPGMSGSAAFALAGR